MAEEELKKQGFWSKIKDKATSYKSSYDDYKTRKMEEAIAKEQKDLEKLEKEQEQLVKAQERRAKIAELKAKNKELRGPTLTEKAYTGVKTVSEGAMRVGDKVSQFGGAANDFFSNLNISGSVSGNASGNPAMRFDSFNTGMGGGFNVDTMLFGGPSKPVMKPVTKRVRPFRSKKVIVKRNFKRSSKVKKRKKPDRKVKRVGGGKRGGNDIFTMLNRI